MGVGLGQTSPVFHSKLNEKLRLSITIRFIEQSLLDVNSHPMNTGMRKYSSDDYSFDVFTIGWCLHLPKNHIFFLFENEWVGALIKSKIMMLVLTIAQLQFNINLKLKLNFMKE